MAKKKKSRAQDVYEALEREYKSRKEESNFVLMDGSKVEKIPRSPSGILSLDLATGGGYPHGRIIEIFGPNAAGKCLTADTYINTSDGVKTIKELFIEHEVVPSSTSKVSEIKAPLVNRYGDLEETTTFVNNGKRRVGEIVTRSGTRIKCTYHHPHLVMSKGGNWIWKKTEELSAEDYLCCHRGRSEEGSTSQDDPSYFIGVLLADGYFGKNRVGVTNNDPDVVTVLKKQGEYFFGVQPKEYPRENTVDFHFNAKDNISCFYEKFGFSPGVAKDKKFPLTLRSSSQREALGMHLPSIIRGYVDCECDISVEKRSMEVTSASYDLLFQLKNLLLSHFGILAFLKKKAVKLYPDTDYWRLSIRGNELASYIKSIGFYSKGRQAKINTLPVDSRGSTNVDSIPYLNNLLSDLYDSTETTRVHSRLLDSYKNDEVGITYNKLEKILACNWGNTFLESRLTEIYNRSYFYDKVESVDYSGEEPTFDFSMGKTHSFIANGIVTHNTTTLIHAVASIQSLGGVCAFIDSEHSLDMVYAKHLGVKPSELLLDQPEFGEQTINAITILCSTLKPGDLIVADSVTAMIPKAVLNRELEDAALVGAHARLMSDGLNKIKGIINKSGVIVIFSNQIRSKIGVSFGNPEVTTGGHALKFYATIRIDVRRIGALKQGETIFGSRTRYKTVKNKSFPPFREVETDIIFGEGVPRSRDVLNLGLSTGIVETRGAWYYYEGEKLGQGFEKSMATLTEAPVALEDMEKRIREIYMIS